MSIHRDASAHTPIIVIVIVIVIVIQNGTLNEPATETAT
jgi:hypothetical protein